MPTRGSIAHAILGIVLLIGVMKTSDSSAQLPVGTEFTYQGRLDFNDQPANGQFDLQFDLFGQAGAGTPLGGNQLVNVPVSEGLFTVTLNFGTAFTGERRWLQISVRPANSGAAFTPLSPRQELTAVPNALRSQSATELDGAVTANADLNGDGQLFVSSSSGLPLVLASADDTDGGRISLFSNESIFSLRAMAVLGVAPSGAASLNMFGPNLEPNVALGGTLGRPNDGGITVYDSFGNARGQIAIGSSGNGILALLGPNGEPNVVLGNVAGAANNGFVSVDDSFGSPRALIAVDSSGQGIVIADVKSFVVDHPMRSDSKIVYISLEGPEAAMFYRGKVQLVEGRATIKLPEHFAVLASAGSISVQLTPESFDSQGLAVGSIGADAIEIGELGGGKGAYDVHFTVMATRKGYEDHEPVISKQEFTERFAPDIAPMKKIGSRVSNELSEKMKERLRATIRGQDLREKRSQ